MSPSSSNEKKGFGLGFIKSAASRKSGEVARPVDAVEVNKVVYVLCQSLLRRADAYAPRTHSETVSMVSHGSQPDLEKGDVRFLPTLSFPSSAPLTLLRVRSFHIVMLTFPSSYTDPLRLLLLQPCQRIDLNYQRRPRPHHSSRLHRQRLLRSRDG
jgi:hypothetical protein